MAGTRIGIRHFTIQFQFFTANISAAYARSYKECKTVLSTRAQAGFHLLLLLSFFKYNSTIL